MAVRDHLRVYIPSSLAPGSQDRSLVSSHLCSPPTRSAFLSSVIESSLIRLRRSTDPMPSPPAVARTILVTGGAGYIGSHTVLQLLKGGFRTVVVDNLDNSSEVAVERVRELAGEFGKNLVFHRVPISPSYSTHVGSASGFSSSGCVRMVSSISASWEWLLD